MRLEHLIFNVIKKNSHFSAAVSFNIDKIVTIYITELWCLKGFQILYQQRRHLDNYIAYKL